MGLLKCFDRRRHDIPRMGFQARLVRVRRPRPRHLQALKEAASGSRDAVPILARPLVNQYMAMDFVLPWPTRFERSRYRHCQLRSASMSR